MGKLTAPSRPHGTILAVNSGSSSLKIGFFAFEDDDEQPLLTAVAENIGRDDGRLRLSGTNGKTISEQNHDARTQEEAFARLLDASRDFITESPTLIGHRIVHGGPNLTAHQVVTAALLKELQAAVHFAPLHIPVSIRLIHQAQEAYPDIANVACFDTAFHHSLPEVARRLPLPAEYDRMGVRRYGFHGLSYESVVHRLGDRVPECTIVAHLGNGSSLCALRWGRSVETTMGLTPTGGIPMATRSGDLDPGVLLFLMRSQGMSADALEVLLNERSGLKALAGESDMKCLLARRAAGDQQAEAAVAAFVHGVRLALGAYAASLSGLDLLVFTGGIGEHSAEIRSLICHGLNILHLSDDSGCSRVAVLPTEEERQIARICRSMELPCKN